MNKEPKWYAIYTKPRWEKKVADLLSKKEIENYCPINKVERQWSDRKKIILEPLFKSYVFVRITDKDHTALRETNGVINIVYWLGKPAVIKNEEIENIKRFMNDYENVELVKIEVNINDKVCITSGPFMDQTGEVLGLTNNIVKVQLPSLGYALVAQIAKSNIKVIPLRKPIFETKLIASN